MVLIQTTSQMNQLITKGDKLLIATDVRGQALRSLH